MSACKSFFRPESSHSQHTSDSVNTDIPTTYAPQDAWLSYLAQEASRKKAGAIVPTDRVHLTLLPNISSGIKRISFLQKRPNLKTAAQMESESYDAVRDLEGMMLDIAHRAEVVAEYFMRSSSAISRRNVRKPLKRARKALGYITRLSDREEKQEPKQDGLFSADDF